MSKAADIASALADRLAGISIENGYLTDMGLRVYRGKQRLDESNIPCSVLVEGDDETQEQDDADVRLYQGYLIEGHAECDPDNPNDTAHLIISDLKRAIFSGDLRIGGLVSGIRYKGRVIDPREDGLKLVSAAIEIDVNYSEDLANP